jgi:hypothetical protein
MAEWLDDGLGVQTSGRGLVSGTLAQSARNLEPLSDVLT